ncbi:hypothetical protein [Stieleria varia]|uniref:Uncharacterized protein n=1 Tax=Stieleria varia TaxID=2528005 RepID=A0A5C6B1C3_9BACT|nr:hypothetical protein [Stieleria varia]TWU05678.1 hypothetical protein Pla52n_13930 [Stieleria varia]
MRFEQITAAITRFVAVTVARGFIGTEAIVRALHLHLPMARMPLGMLCYSGSGSSGGYPLPVDLRSLELKRNIELAIDKQGVSPWQRILPSTQRPEAGLRLANC